MEAIETKDENYHDFDLKNHKKVMDEKMNSVDVEELLSRNDTYIPRRRRPLYEAPEFIKRLSAFEEVKAGTTVVFECKYKSFPKSTIKWYKDDEEITDDNRYETESEASGDLRIIIRDCRKADEGAYKCKAENSEGVASSTGYLSVTGEVADKPLSAQPRKNASEHIISAAPPLRTILEQKSVEEREAEALAHQPPSPLQNFLKDHRNRTWPLSYMGYGGHSPQTEHSHSYDHLDNKGGGDDEVNPDESSESDSDTSVDSQGDLLDDKVRFSLKSSSPRSPKKTGVLENGDLAVRDLPNTVGPQDGEEDLGVHGDEEPVKVESMIIVNRNKLAELGMSDVYEPGVGKLDMAPNWDASVRQKAPVLLRTTNVDHDDEPATGLEEAPLLISSSSRHQTTRSSNSLQNFANVLDHLQFPNLYYLAFLSGVTFWAAGWEVSPLLVILLVSIVSFISFRFLPDS